MHYYLFGFLVLSHQPPHAPSPEAVIFSKDAEEAGGKDFSKSSIDKHTCTNIC